MVQLEERIRRTVMRTETPVSAPRDAGAPRDWSWVPFALLVAVAFALRLWDLGGRAMHHDESLHGLYSWYLYVGRDYKHDPMMHGPFLFHLTALLYLLFGDSEVTARLPMALMGAAAVGLPFFLRNELGRYGAIAAAVMLALGPSFLYMSRFGHNEGMLVFQTLLVVVGLFGWVRERKPAYLYITAIGFALLFTTKIVVLLFGFVIFTFIAAFLLVERFRPLEYSVAGTLREIGVKTLAICVAIFFGISIVLYTTFFTNLEGLCTALISPQIGSCAGKQGMLQYWAAQQPVARGGQPWFYYFMLIPLYEIIPAVLALAAPFLARRPRTLFFWFSVWWAVVTIGLYTYASEKMPWLVVHLALPLVILGAQAVDVPLGRLRWPWGLAPRQWAVAGLSLLTLAALIAWFSGAVAPGALALDELTARLRRIGLTVVLAGILAGTVYVALSLRGRQTLAAVAAAGLLILASYSLHTAWQVAYKNGDVPVELLVYVQSSPDIPYVIGELERVGNQLGLRKDVPILLDGGYVDTVNGQRVEHEAVSWPFEWYLRDFKGKQYYSRDLPADFSSNKYAAVIVMGTNLDPVRDKLGNYTGNKYRLNWWYPEDYKGLSWQGLGEALLDPTARMKLLKYVLYRELINPPLGARELYVYVRNDLARGGGVAPVEAAAPARAAEPRSGVELQARSVSSIGRGAGQAGLRDPKGVAYGPNGYLYVTDGATSMVQVFDTGGTLVRSWGRKGASDGELNEPWGIAVGADGSVYVADTWNHRVQKFDSEGRFLLKWGTGEIGSEQGRFYGPRDIVVTPFGEVLVTDTGNKRIQVFDESGTFKRSFGSEGTTPGQFREPVGLAVDREGRVYVADTWNERIQVFDAGMQPVAQYPVQGWSSRSINNKPYLAVGTDGDVYATIPESGAILRVKNGVVERIAVEGGPRLRLPVGIAFDSVGRLAVADAGGGVVVAYDLTPGEGLPGAAGDVPSRAE